MPSMTPVLELHALFPLRVDTPLKNSGSQLEWKLSRVPFTLQSHSLTRVEKNRHDFVITHPLIITFHQAKCCLHHEIQVWRYFKSHAILHCGQGNIHVYCILRGRIKGTASAVFVIQHRKAVPLFLAIPFMYLRIQ